jgi:hypothetical protein
MGYVGVGSENKNNEKLNRITFEFFWIVFV